MHAYPTIPQLGTVLGVWAHPDDEAYLSAGLMALARRHGQRVVVVTATDGELGGTTAAVRRRELTKSLAVLGVQEHHGLGLPDGGCADVPEACGVAMIRRVMDEVRPDTILTFGPDGMTGHPDHRAVSAWTTGAWRTQCANRAPGRRARLWYATKTADFHTEWSGVNHQIALWDPEIEPPCTPVARLATAVECTGELRVLKRRALDAHRSQTAALAAFLGSATYDRWCATEAFVSAAAVAAPSAFAVAEPRWADLEAFAAVPA
jgi:LmbE family N-acetylglucosaminyl deacetylase